LFSNQLLRSFASCTSGCTLLHSAGCEIVQITVNGYSDAAIPATAAEHGLAVFFDPEDKP